MKFWKVIFHHSTLPKLSVPHNLLISDNPLPIIIVLAIFWSFLVSPYNYKLGACSASLWPVCRVWLILTRSWVCQQSCTSGAGAQNVRRNYQACHYTIGTSAQKQKLQNLRGAHVRYLRKLRIILGAPSPYSAFWLYGMLPNEKDVIQSEKRGNCTHKTICSSLKCTPKN